MLVGMTVALGASTFGTNIENVGFDEEIFMYLLLPPIIFEAALTVNKREFRRRRGAIFIFAMFGTVFSSFLTGIATYTRPSTSGTRASAFWTRSSSGRSSPASTP